MAKSIFIAATGQNCGKTTTSIALMHLAQKKYRRVGFMKPLGPKAVAFQRRSLDKDALLMAQLFTMEEELRWMSPVVVQPDMTRKVVDGEISPRDLLERISLAYAELEKRCDFVIIEGSGHPGVGSVMKTSNARIARLLDAPVLMVTGGGLGSVVDKVSMGLALFEKEGVHVRGLLANKLIAAKRERTLDYLQRALADEKVKVIGGVDYQPVLANPTLRRVARLLRLPIRGNPQAEGTIIHSFLIGAASTQRVTEMIREPSLLIVTSSRDELLVTLANLYNLPAWRSRIVGLIIPGTAPISAITQMILDRSSIPYLRAEEHNTAQLYRLVTEDVSKITAVDHEKVALIKRLAETHLDFDLIDELF